MPGKYEKKQVEKEALKGSRIAKQKQLDGRDRKFSRHIDVEGNKSMEAPLILTPTTPSTPLEAAPTKGYLDGQIQALNIAFSGHGHNYAPSGHRHPEYALEGSRTATNQDHNHGISFTTFVKRSKEERRAMLDDRGNLSVLLDSGLLRRREEVIARNVHNLLGLLMDYRDFDAYERERRLEDPEWAEWAEDYKRAFGMDEYAEEDREAYVTRGKVRHDPYSGIAPVREEEHAAT
jgi:hypothetical protein